MAATKEILGAFNLDDTVSFQVYPLAIYGDVFKNATPTDIVSAATARKFGTDTAAAHAAAYSYLPSGTVQDNPESYKWLVVTLFDGTQRVIGLPWIMINTITVVSQVNATIVISGIASGDIENLKNLLSSNNYPNYTITTN